MHRIVLLDDHVEKGAVRRAHFDQHLAFLTANRDHIRHAGPLLAEAGPGEPAGVVGGLWVVEGGTDDTIRGLIEADPLHAAGLRRSWRVHQWVKVFADGKPTGVRP